MYVISQMIFPELDTGGIHLFSYLTEKASDVYNYTTEQNKITIKKALLFPLNFNNVIN